MEMVVVVGLVLVERRSTTHTNGRELCMIVVVCTMAVECNTQHGNRSTGNLISRSWKVRGMYCTSNDLISKNENSRLFPEDRDRKTTLSVEENKREGCVEAVHSTTVMETAPKL